MNKNHQNIKKEVNINLRNEEVQEIMGHVPRWITRWGITLIALIIIGLMIGSWFFMYPDVISSPLIITTENPPASVVAKSTGKIQILLVEDEQFVKKDQHLAVIENPASYYDILKLQKNLIKISSSILNIDTLGFIEPKTGYKLGEVQQAYAIFSTNYFEYLSFTEINYHSNKVASVEDELKKYKVYYNRLYRQKELLNNELLLANTQFQRDSSLYKGNVIAQAELDKSTSNVLQKKHDFEQARINLAKVDIQISELEQEIQEFKMVYAEERKNHELQLIESFNNLSSEIAAWEQKYLLKAPSKGYVSFTKFWSEDQNVVVDEKAFTVVPEQAGNLVAKMNLSIRRSGKVNEGQRVNIKIDNYPYMEYGMLKGFVKNISMVPSDNSYVVELELPDSLTTLYKLNLEFDQEMTGVGEIITEDRRLLSRIIDPVKYIVERNIRH